MSTLKRILGIKIPATTCGHMTKIKGKVSAFGETTTITVPVEDGKTLYCHDCLGKMTIRCAWCENLIFIGFPITLYTPKDPNNFEVPKGAHVHSQNPLTLVGCLSRDCADIGADRAGFWHPPGEVYRMLSPLEIAAQGNVVITNDLSNIGATPIVVPIEDE